MIPDRQPESAVLRPELSDLVFTPSYDLMIVEIAGWVCSVRKNVARLNFIGKSYTTIAPVSTSLRFWAGHSHMPLPSLFAKSIGNLVDHVIPSIDAAERQLRR